MTRTQHPPFIFSKFVFAFSLGSGSEPAAKDQRERERGGRGENPCRDFNGRLWKQKGKGVREQALLTHVRNKERKGKEKEGGTIREESASNGQIFFIEETPPLLGLHLRALFQSLSANNLSLSLSPSLLRFEEEE